MSEQVTIKREWDDAETNWYRYWIEQKYCIISWNGIALAALWWWCCFCSLFFGVCVCVCVFVQLLGSPLAVPVNFFFMIFTSTSASCAQSEWLENHYLMHSDWICCILYASIGEFKNEKDNEHVIGAALLLLLFVCWPRQPIWRCDRRIRRTEGENWAQINPARFNWDTKEDNGSASMTITTANIAIKDIFL